MPTRETQNIIIEKALALFNEQGTKAISTNRIADECQLSRGHLHYHFRTKEEIIQMIFQRIRKEMLADWFEDHLHPTMEYMQFMFMRQIKMIWRYRFFYRELTPLLQKDPHLKTLFISGRKTRFKEVKLFFEEMIKTGLMVEVATSTLDSILQITWFVSDQWVSYLDMHGMAVEEASVNEGYQLILQVLQPYLTEKSQQQTLESSGRRELSASGHS